MVVLAPRWSNVKTKLDLAKKLNPIVQEKNKAGKGQFVPNYFPYHGFLWNFGILPQTCMTKHSAGPVEVCEIGSTVHDLGSVIEVKILGAIAFVKDDTVVWKILAVDKSDPLAKDMKKFDESIPPFDSLLEHTREWLKVLTGLPPLQVDEKFQFQNGPNAEKILADLHNDWNQNFLEGTDARVCWSHTQTPGNPKTKMTNQEAGDFVKNQPASSSESQTPGHLAAWTFAKIHF